MFERSEMRKGADRSIERISNGKKRAEMAAGCRVKEAHGASV